ncbi:hypothetical protein ILUMI_03024 [Ignelater luminosus]|uniref:Peptidase S1 domain-containing protein n=1 Tax=Ignelater luminosus TaxID=2038154 RepID=A0A8K0GKV2_IGNLU|nr:hypothetical protein ILUMI_03024 [Ignelater luminosus]
MKVVFIIILGASLILNVALLIAIVTMKSPPSSTKCNDKSKALLLANERIVGGVKVDNMNKYPFMVSLVIKKDAGLKRDAFKCGAAIITRQWVVTAAHCFEETPLINIQHYKIYSNSLIWWKGLIHDIKSYFVHPNFNEAFYTENDIALAKVKNPFLLKFEKPVTIAGDRYSFETNRSVTIIGWGLPYDYKAHDARPLNDLYETQVKLFDQKYCSGLYSKDKHVRVAKTMICAADYTGGKDACVFDSGGPMLDKTLLIGLISWGGVCGVATSPGVYTRINAFNKWILHTGKRIDENFKPVFKNEP